MNNFFKHILDFIFPQECAGCGQELHTPFGKLRASSNPSHSAVAQGKLYRGELYGNGMWLCDYCFSKIEFNKKQICPLCGRFFKLGYSCVCTVGSQENNKTIKQKNKNKLENSAKTAGGAVGILNFTPSHTTGQEFQILNNKEDQGWQVEEDDRKKRKSSIFNLPAPACTGRQAGLQSKISGVDVYITFVDLKKNPQVAKLIHKLKYNFVEGAAEDLAKIGVEFLRRNNLLEKLGMGEGGNQILNDKSIRQAQDKLQISKKYQNLNFPPIRRAGKFQKNSENGESGNERGILFIPVPLHKKRFLWRGFNQSELILKEMARKWQPADIETLAGEEDEEGKEEKEGGEEEKLEIRNLKLEIRNDILMRKKNTFFQGKNKMSEKDRILNMRGAFVLHTPNPPSSDGTVASYRGELGQESICGKTVILFDDVITTGATVEECARVLKKAGAARVIAMAVGKG